MPQDDLGRILALDDAYEVIKVLAPHNAATAACMKRSSKETSGPSNAGRSEDRSSASGGPLKEPVSELVRLAGDGPFVRKRIPLALANTDAWKAARQATSPLLPRIETLYELPDQLVVICEYVPGISAAQAVAQSGAFEPLQAVRVTLDVCEAAACLHAQEVVHRDITPSNVILGDDGRAHLIDLGIARKMSETAHHDTTRLGTWGYAAPEQYGFAQTDARSDIYSLGGLLGFLLVGIRPGSDEFDRALEELRSANAIDGTSTGRTADAATWASSDMAANAAASTSAKTSIDTVNNSSAHAMIKQLAAIIRKARSFEPAKRYQTVEELKAALLEAASSPSASEGRPSDEKRSNDEGFSHSADVQHRGILKSFFGLIRPANPYRSELGSIWQSARWSRRLIALATFGWVAFVLYAVATNPDLLNARGASRFLYLALSGATFLFWGIVPAWEISCALLGAGMYKTRRKRALVCILRVALSILVGVIALFALALIIELFAWLLLGRSI